MDKVSEAIDEIRAENPELADQAARWAAGVRQYFAQEDLRGLVRNFMDKAQGFHALDAPDTGERDRHLKAAQDMIDGRRDAFPALADEMQAEIDRLRAQFEADDVERARAKPQGRTEALQSFDDMVDSARKRLRAAGDRAAAADLVDRADEVAEALNDAEDAHKSGDTAARDAALDRARAAIPPLESIDPDIAEAARQAVEGNAARFARSDAAGPVADGVAGWYSTTDAARVERANNLADALAAALDQNNIRAYDMNALERFIDQGGIPGVSTVRMLGGGINGAVLVIKTDDGTPYALKYDSDTRGREAEVASDMFLRDLGLLAPVGLGVGGLEDRGLVMTEFLDAGWEGMPDVRFGPPPANMLSALDPVDTLHMLMADGVIGNTDRHHHNMFWGQDTNGVARLIAMDQSRALMNMHGSTADLEDLQSHHDPLKSLRSWWGDNDGGSWMTDGALGSILKNLEKIHGRAAAETILRDEITKFARRMAERAEMLQGLQEIDPALAMFLKTRSEWFLEAQNIDAFLKLIRKYRKHLG
jgi:hypothetical protein